MPPAAAFYRAIDDTGHLAPHIPVLYNMKRLEEEEEAGEASPQTIHRRPTVTHLGGIEVNEKYRVQMQDLAAGMIRPCGMGFVMGVRTATPADFAPEQAAPRAEVLEACREIDPIAPTPEEEAQGGMTQLRHLAVLDAASSTASLGFRIDAARTVVNGEQAPLPFEEGTRMERLRAEADVAGAIKMFLQGDGAVARAAAFKADAMAAAWEKATDFTERHVLLRTTLLLVYDDAHRENGCELKMMNFGFSYRVEEGGVRHDAPWDGTEGCHEDGWLTGVRNLARVLRAVEVSCAEAVQ